MKELITLNKNTINNEIVETVSARDLYTFVESKQEFSNWIKNRIEKYGFVEDMDFLIKLSKTPNGGRPSREYYITLDMAKQLAMVENNDKGMEIRKYFIECERKLKEQSISQPVQPIGELEDKVRSMYFAISMTKLSDTAKECLLLTTTESITGTKIPYRPKVEQRTYSAREVGDQLGISANMVGRIANAHGIKTSEYGEYHLSKSEYMRML